jgi:nudix-type nucleoside diphosphatase (YffH/AdpP family)
MAEIISTEVKYRGWSTFLIATIRLASGQTITRAIEDHGNAVGVLPYDPVRRTAILVKQLRAPALYAAKQPHFLEVVAGRLDEGEAPAHTARRETLEEAGLKLRTIEPVAQGWAMAGVSTEQMDLFLAEYSQSDRVSAGGGIDEEHENIEVIEMPLAELAAMTDSGALKDMKALVLVQTLRLRRPELFG